MKKARTTQIIKGGFVTVPVGTIFEVTDDNPHIDLVKCNGLPFQYIWKSEFAYLDGENVPPTANDGVLINGTLVSFMDLQADVNAAINQGFANQFAFTPETVQALLTYIAENKKK